MDEWLDDKDNLTNKWEDNSLTASDRRIHLLATWFFKACNKVLEGDAKVQVL